MNDMNVTQTGTEYYLAEFIDEDMIPLRMVTKTEFKAFISALD